MSASMVNVDYGTRRGWGEPLSEDTPFVPDSLCTQCLAVLDGLDYNKSGALQLDLSQNSNDCRLCALLFARLRATATTSVLEIEYHMVPRYGYFIRVFDVVFVPVGSKNWRTNAVRLGIQKKKRDPNTDGDHPPMVYFESKISPATDSESSMAQVAKWFKTCCEEHESCKPETPTSFVPSRLLEISGSDESTMKIRLRERPTLPVEVCYTTLSHCWGSVMPFKLKHALLKSCLNGISLDEISRVFRDAIRVAWRLGIQYIWIDSLCIIQDSLEDWTAESVQMGSIYQHGVLNIAATGFSDGTNGLFVQRDPGLLAPISFSLGTDHLSHGNAGEDKEQRYKALKPGNYYLVDTGVWKDGVDDSPLCGRGWVTQERALSVRTIHFGKEQLFWECLCENASEVLPKGTLRGTKIMDPKVFLVPETNATEKLQSIRKDLLEHQKFNDDFIARTNELKRMRKRRIGNIMASDDEDSDNEDSDDKCGSDDDMSDKAFAARMLAARSGGLAVPKGTKAAGKSTKPNKAAPQSSGTDSDEWNYDLKSVMSGKWKPPRRSLKGLGLTPQDFEDCDLDILDGLDIKGWEKFKAQLQGWNIGRQANSVEPRPIRGMPQGLNQWAAVVRFFSRCSLSFSSDKLVAISGMAQTLAPKLKCDYLAGLWRKDLEHQLLWKVTQPHPAPEKNNTRGPSWTWASVDGEIDIPEWGGYFSHGIAGDITWMAKVDDVSVQLAETGEYGQAQSGTLTLTGRLGVLRIVKNVSNDKDHQDADRNPESKKLWIAASWDTQELAEQFGTSGQRTYVKHHPTYWTRKGARLSMHPLDVFFVPVRVMDADPDEHDYEQPMLTGLLLLPTGDKKGTFRRVGQFELSGHWMRPHEEAFETLSKSTAQLDNTLYVSKHKRGEYTICIV